MPTEIHRTTSFPTGTSEPGQHEESCSGRDLRNLQLREGHGRKTRSQAVVRIADRTAYRLTADSNYRMLLNSIAYSYFRDTGH